MSKKSKPKTSKPQRRRKNRGQGHPAQLKSTSESDAFKRDAFKRDFLKRQLQALIVCGKSSRLRALLACHPWLLETTYPETLTREITIPPKLEVDCSDQVLSETVCHYYRPLHLAAMQGRADIVRLLIRCGADVMATTGPPHPLLPSNLLIQDAQSHHLASGKLPSENSPSEELPSEPTHVPPSHLTVPYRSKRTLHLPLYSAVLPDADSFYPRFDGEQFETDQIDGDERDKPQSKLKRKVKRQLSHRKRHRRTVRMGRRRVRIARLLLKQMRKVVAQRWFYDLTLAETIEQVLAETADADCVDDVFALETLHAAGVDWEARDLQGFSALHQAVVYENLAAYEWLMEKGLDPNPTDNAGNTPLHLALWWGSDEILVTVLRSPCDPLLPNHMGVSPYELVLRSGCPVLRQLFQAYPAIQKHRQNQMDKGNQNDE
jgi:ankyrin repeat protein